MLSYFQERLYFMNGNRRNIMEPLSTVGDMYSSKMSLSGFGSGVFSATVIKFKY